VTCAVKTYTVGGTVSGLDGVLVLQNNGADDETVTTDGSFTFDTPIADGSPYDVTVYSRPATQNCAVTDGSGTISGADVTDVAVACTNKAWNHPDDLETDGISANGEDGEYVEVAMNGKTGDTIVVWQQYDGFNYRVYMKEYRNGSWAAAKRITDDAVFGTGTHDEEYPHVAIDESGNAIIVWQCDDGCYSQIFISEYRNGSWSHPATFADHICPIDPNPTNAYNPRVAMDNNGNAIVVWKQYDADSDNQVFMSEYRNGAWDDPDDLDDNISPDGHGAYDPKVAMDNNENAIIIWQQSDGANKQLYMAEYRNGDWSAATDARSLDGQEVQSVYDVAMSDDGSAIIVWRQSDGVNKQIFKSEYRNSAWIDPADFDDNLSKLSPTTDSNHPEVAMDDDGNAIVIWELIDGAPPDKMYMSRYQDGSWDSSPTQVSFAGSSTGYIDVAMDNNGQIILAWNQDGPTGKPAIFMREYRDDVWSPDPVTSSDYINVYDGSSSAFDPEVAMDPNGDAIIVWEQEDEDGDYRIYMSEFR
jgi:hypothetical protein